MKDLPTKYYVPTLFFSAQKNAFLYIMQIYAGVVIRNLLKNSYIIEKPKTKFKFLQNSARPWRTRIFVQLPLHKCSDIFNTIYTRNITIYIPKLYERLYNTSVKFPIQFLYTEFLTSISMPRKYLLYYTHMQALVTSASKKE